MTQTSDEFLTALNAVVKDYFPSSVAKDFMLYLPLGDQPAKTTYTSPLFAASAHDTLKHELFKQKVTDLFAPGNPGAVWLAEADFLQQPAQEFGLINEDEINSDNFQTRDISPENKQPRFRFGIHDKWVQINEVSFQDGRLFRGQRSPVHATFKTLKTQKELKRFFHLLSHFKGPMRLWRVYYCRTNVTLRAPDRASACFLVHAMLTASKSLKSDTYGIETSWRIFCNEVDPDHVIDKYQQDMKTISIL